MDVEIRRIADCEAEKLSRLAIAVYTAAFGHSFAAEDLAAHLEARLSVPALRLALQKDVFLGAEAEGALTGFIQFGAQNGAASAPPESAREIRRLYVLPERQRQGIGGKLMEAALSHPELKLAKTVVLDVWERNEGAQRLYRKFGFKVVGARTFIFASGREGDNDLIMAWNP